MPTFAGQEFRYCGEIPLSDRPELYYDRYSRKYPQKPADTHQCGNFLRSECPSGRSAFTTSAALCFYIRSDEHTSELQSLMRLSHAVFCFKKYSHRAQNNRDDTQSTHRPHKHTATLQPIKQTT